MMLDDIKNGITYVKLKEKTLVREYWKNISWETCLKTDWLWCYWSYSSWNYWFYFHE